MAERSYEVYGFDGARWLIDSVHEWKTDALRRCDELARDTGNGFESVKVMEEGRFQNRAILIHEQSCARTAPTRLQVQPIDEAPFCQRQIDYYALRARLVVSRLLRQFLDQERITALELLHDSARLRRLLRDDRLYPQALGRVAAIQSRMTDMTPAQRSQELDQAVNAIIRRAKVDRGADELARHLERRGVSAMLAALPAGLGSAQRAFQISAALAAYLKGHVSWDGKALALAELLERDPTPEACELVDEALAEILDCPPAVRDILGPRGNLGEALCERVRFARGQLAVVGDEEATAAAALNEQLAAERLPKGREALLRGVRQTVAGTKPLTRQGGHAEREAFQSLVNELSSVGGLVGGPDMADAVTRRARTVFGDGHEDLGPEEGVKATLKLLGPRSTRVGYLLALAASNFGTAYRPVMIDLLSRTLHGLTRAKAMHPEATDQAVYRDMIRELRAHLELLERPQPTTPIDAEAKG